MAEVTERIEEYRVVGDRVGFRGPFTLWPNTADRDQAARDLTECQRDGFPGMRVSNIRLMVRTTTRTPWVDLDEQEGK